MRFTYQTGAQPLDGYTIQRGIHRGGFGEVYFARSHGGKEVALKLLHDQDQDVEIRGVTQCLNLKHPNLINLHDVKSDQHGDFWVIMEYVSGSSLEDVLTSFPGGLPPSEIGDWMNGLIAGVAFLHDRGIVHRDLKPANIYREAGIVKVGDVGLSKRLNGDRRQNTQSVGTVYYMAPEVAKGQYGPEVDVYSLGVILYEMVTGKLPFSGETTGEILMKHLTAQPDLSIIPKPLRATIARALEKDPNKRTASVRQLGREVRNALGIGATSSGETSRANAPFAEDDHANPSIAQRAGVLVDSIKQRIRTAKPSKIAFYTFVSFLVTVVLIRAFSRASSLLSWRMIFVAVIAAVVVRYFVTRRNRIDEIPMTKHASTPIPFSQVQAAMPFNTWVDVGPAVMNSLGISTFLSGGMIAIISSWLNSNGQQSPLLSSNSLVAFLSATSMIACWGILLSHAWTLTSESARRRSGLLRLSTGLLVGVCAYGLSRFLMVDVPSAAFTTEAAVSASKRLWLVDVTNPTWVGFSLFFALWMAVNGWSRTLHPRRQHRLRVVSIAFAIGSAYLISSLCSFPQFYAMIWAGVISTSVQLASFRTPRSHSMAVRP